MVERILAQEVEVFIDEDGNALGAGGGDYMGEDDHELVALKRAIEGTLEEWEIDVLEIWEVAALNQEQQQRVDAANPGFVQHMQTGLAKEYAVEHWGWIRVHGTNFEVHQVTDEALSRMAGYAEFDLEMSPDRAISINEQSTGAYVDMTIQNINEYVQMGQGASMYQRLARQPPGLY